MKYINMLKRNQESVKSFHLCLAGRQACKSVIQTTYDIVKAHGGELTVRTKEATGIAGEESGTEFIIQLNTSF